MNRYFYTFGTDPAFPYKEGWVEVHANTPAEADEKFRRRFPDHPGHEVTFKTEEERRR